MKLYSFALSTMSRPVLLFTADAGIPLELEEIDLRAKQHRSPSYLALNPNGLVPFLVDGELKLSESTAILRYLANKVASPAYPSDPARRAKVDEALGWFSTQFHTDFCRFTVYPQLGIPHDLSPAFAEQLVQYGQSHAPRWFSVLEREMIGEHRFVCGDAISLADFLGVAFVTLGEAIGFDISPYPNIQRWIGDMKALPAWAAAWAPFDAAVAARIQAQSPAPPI